MLFREHELPADRAPGSFRYRVTFLDDGNPVEQVFTDDDAERNHLVRHGCRYGQSVLVDVQGAYSILAEVDRLRASTPAP
jgi:hypothetical protein